MKWTLQIVFVPAALAFLLSACGGSESSTAEKKGVDRSDVAATANAILTAYKDRNLTDLATLCNRTNRPMFEEIASQGETHSRYDSIFRGWRWETVAGWDGSIREVRYAGRGVASAHFADMEGDEIAVVVVQWQDGKWAFEDVNRPDRATFEEYDSTRPE